jgi:hypothetical protein
MTSIPTLVSKPFHGDGWVYEEKVDGYRMVAYKDRPPRAPHQPQRPFDADDGVVPQHPRALG